MLEATTCTTIYGQRYMGSSDWGRAGVWQPTYMADRYAVAVLKQETIIEHFPRKISKVCSLFLRRGGSIRCTVTGSRRHSSDLSLVSRASHCVITTYVPVLNIHRKFFRCKIISHKKFSYIFSVRKYFYNEKKQITVHTHTSQQKQYS